MEFWFVFFGFLDYPIHLVLGDTGGFIATVKKAGNPLGGTNGNPRVVSKLHLDKNITRESFFGSFNFLATADNHFALSGNDSLKNFVF